MTPRSFGALKARYGAGIDRMSADGLLGWIELCQVIGVGSDRITSMPRAVTVLGGPTVLCYDAPMGSKVVSYIRVSSRKQGQSGLGIEAQRATVEAYMRANNCELIMEYVEVESARRDSLRKRPALRQALAHCKREHAVLIVAKLDRLTRSVAVTSALHEARVDFVCCDMPAANRMTIQIMAVVAEQESRATSDRTKAALQAMRDRGDASALHLENLTTEGRRKGAAGTREVWHEKTARTCGYVAPTIRRLKDQGLSLRGIAAALNADGRFTVTGLPWNPVQVSRELARM